MRASRARDRVPAASPLLAGARGLCQWPPLISGFAFVATMAVCAGCVRTTVPQQSTRGEGKRTAWTRPCYINSVAITFELDNTEDPLILPGVRSNSIALGDRRVQVVGKDFLIQGHPVSFERHAVVLVYRIATSADYSIEADGVTIVLRDAAGIFPVRETVDRRTTRWFIAHGVIRQSGQRVDFVPPATRPARSEEGSVSSTRTFSVPVKLTLDRRGELLEYGPP